MMTAAPPLTLKPMSTFDPTRPALLHDQLNDKMLAWTGEELAGWREHANPHSQGIIEWDGLLLDGWCEPLGG
jgi:hypothetical protein